MLVCNVLTCSYKASQQLPSASGIDLLLFTLNIFPMRGRLQLLQIAILLYRNLAIHFVHGAMALSQDLLVSSDVLALSVLTRFQKQGAAMRREGPLVSSLVTSLLTKGRIFRTFGIIDGRTYGH